MNNLIEKRIAELKAERANLLSQPKATRNNDRVKAINDIINRLRSW